MNRGNIGSTLDSLLGETGDLEEVNERVGKRIFAALSSAQAAGAWRTWVQRGSDGPIEDDDETSGA